MCYRLQYRMDNLHYRLFFDLGKFRHKNVIPEKNVLEAVKFQNLIWSQKAVKYRKYRLAKFENFLYLYITYGTCYHV